MSVATLGVSMLSACLVCIVRDWLSNSNFRFVLRMKMKKELRMTTMTVKKEVKGLTVKKEVKGLTVKRRDLKVQKKQELKGKKEQKRQETAMRKHSPRMSYKKTEIRSSVA